MKTVSVPVGEMTEDGCLLDGDPEYCLRTKFVEIPFEELPECVQREFLRQQKDNAVSSDGQVGLPAKPQANSAKPQANSAKPQADSSQRKTMFSKFTILSE